VATIGQLSKVEGGAFKGRLRTLLVQLSIELDPVADKASANSPDFRVFAKVDSGAVEIGGAWKKTVERSGAIFLSMTLDDPSFPAALNLAAFPPDDDGPWDMVWNRPRQMKEAA